MHVLPVPVIVTAIVIFGVTTGETRYDLSPPPHYPEAVEEAVLVSSDAPEYFSAPRIPVCFRLESPPPP